MSESITQSLQDHLIAQIQSRGPLAFSTFMERALYQPGHGFYRRGENVVGRTGHFFTSASVGPLFGEILGARIHRQWEDWGRPEEWVLAEQGANDGRLMIDILSCFRNRRPEMLSGLRCWIFEPDTGLRAQQEACLRESDFIDRIEWHSALSEVASGGGCGFFYSNELLDSLPFDLVVYRGGEWKEKRVDSLGNSLIWSEVPCSPELITRIQHWELPELEGYQTEVHPGISTWAKSVFPLFSPGVVMTVDYGFRSREYYAATRATGTARSYREHRLSDNLLATPGQTDLTCHVNFDLLDEMGREAGYDVVYDHDQHHFLVGEAARSGLLAEWEHQVNANPDDPKIQKLLRQFKTLMHPEIMGSQFKIFIQERKKDTP